MRSLGDLILPPVNDAFLGARVASLRGEVLASVGGRVVEVGAGSGLNFAHYPSDASVLAIEPAPAMRARAERRRREDRAVRARIELLDGRAGALPVDAASVDHVVFTFVLCSVRDVAGALREAKRVLKPGGRLVVLEHCLDPDPRIARWQRFVQPAWGLALAGCQLVRDLPREIERAGFDGSVLDAIALPLPRIVRHGVRGTCAG